VTALSLGLSLAAVLLSTASAVIAIKQMRLADRRVKLAHETCDLRLEVVASANNYLQGLLTDESVSDEMRLTLKALDLAVKGIPADAD
jgi:hypothetical protein